MTVHKALCKCKCKCKLGEPWFNLGFLLWPQGKGKVQPIFKDKS